MFFKISFGHLAVIITRTHSAAKSKYAITTPPATYLMSLLNECKRLYCLQKEGLANKKIDNNEQKQVWLKRHQFVTDGTRSKQINRYQQVTAVEHVINRGCSIVSIAPLPQCTSLTPPHSKCPRDVSQLTLLCFDGDCFEFFRHYTRFR